MQKGTILTAGLAVAFLLMITPAFASSGPLDITNCSGGGVTVGVTTITWLPSGEGTDDGCINTGATTNVVYTTSTLGPGETGNIKNLTMGTLPLDQFMTFVGTPLDFILTSLPPASSTNGTNCASTTRGQSCVAFAGSPFLFTNLGDHTAISLQAVGTVSDGDSISNWSGVFTTQLNQTAASIQTTLLLGGSITSTHSAQFTVIDSASPVPERGSRVSADTLRNGPKSRTAARTNRERSVVQIQPPQPWALRGKSSKRPSYLRLRVEP